MYDSIWNVLGITQTTDRKAIQKAYSEQLKKYHPEEHPEEFQKLQEAYRRASAYARNKGQTSELAEEVEVPVKEPVDISSIEPEDAFASHIEVLAEVPLPGNKENTKEEDVPNYFSDINKVDLRDKYVADMDEYVLLLKEKLLGRQTKKDLKTLDELFRDNRFCTMIGTKDFTDRYYLYMEYESKINRAASKIMAQNLQHLISDNRDVNSNLIKWKDYFVLRSRREQKYDKKTMQAIVLGLLMALLFWVGFFIFTMVV